MNKKQVEKIIGYAFKDEILLLQALVHSSYANEHKIASNERLEFLGDAVLEFVITDKLYKDFNLSEGKLTKYRASLVNQNTLAFIVSELGLDKYLIRGKGESKSGQVTDAEKCDLFEAVVGAIYLDGGISAAKKFILTNLVTALDSLATNGLEENYKSQLQEMLIKDKIVYSTTKHGDDHDPVYKCTVIINGVNMGFGQGKNKKTAEKEAAKNTIKMIKKA